MKDLKLIFEKTMQMNAYGRCSSICIFIDKDGEIFKRIESTMTVNGARVSLPVQWLTVKSYIGCEPPIK